MISQSEITDGICHAPVSITVLCVVTFKLEVLQ